MPCVSARPQSGEEQLLSQVRSQRLPLCLASAPAPRVERNSCSVRSPQKTTTSIPSNDYKIFLLHSATVVLKIHPTTCISPSLPLSDVSYPQPKSSAPSRLRPLVPTMFTVNGCAYLDTPLSFSHHLLRSPSKFLFMLSHEKRSQAEETTCSNPLGKGRKSIGTHGNLRLYRVLTGDRSHEEVLRCLIPTYWQP